MKRAILYFTISIIAISPVSSEILHIGTIQASTYNSVLEMILDTSFTVLLDMDTDLYSLAFHNTMSKGYVDLDNSQMQRLRETLDKYCEWEVLATESQVKIDKQIPDSSIVKSRISFSYGDNWYHGNNLSITFTFFSFNEDSHSLLIQSNKIFSSSNKYIDFQIDLTFLDKTQVQYFIETISEDSIKALLVEYQTKKDNEAMFN